MYEFGFYWGLSAGVSSSLWDDAAVISGAIVSGFLGPDGFQPDGYDMIYLSQGLWAGYYEGLRQKDSH
ncbi:hypothetical protein FACS1894203_5740 [Bacteroidia bacterium]|nr:hypothetical protein FACS1894203_5740 [Bacteroidia bacterium]